MTLSEIQLPEMTMTTGKLPVPDVTFPDTSQHIGDIEGPLPIFMFQHQDTTLYGIKIDGAIASWTQLRPIAIAGHQYEEILVTKTLPKYRGQRLSWKLKFFIKTHLQKPLIFGSVQSEDTIESTKKMVQTGRFDVKWINTKTGELQQYDPRTDITPSQFRSHTTKTDWRIMLETLDDYSMYPLPKFFDKDNYLSYATLF